MRVTSAAERLARRRFENFQLRPEPVHLARIQNRYTAEESVAAIGIDLILA